MESKIRLKEILFVCTGNSCRSVMAEGLFNKRAKEREVLARARSAGVAAPEGLSASELTMELLKEEDVDLSAHRTRRLSQDMIEDADAVIVMDRMHERVILDKLPQFKDKVKMITRFYKGKDQKLVEFGIPDPIGKNQEFYENVMTIIRESVDNILDWVEGGMKP